MRNCSGPRPLTGDSRVPQTPGEAGGPHTRSQGCGDLRAGPPGGRGEAGVWGGGFAAQREAKGVRPSRRAWGTGVGALRGGAGRWALCPPGKAEGKRPAGRGPGVRRGDRGKMPGRGTPALRLGVKRVRSPKFNTRCESTCLSRSAACFPQAHQRPKCTWSGKHATQCQAGRVSKGWRGKRREGRRGGRGWKGGEGQGGARVRRKRRAPQPPGA